MELKQYIVPLQKWWWLLLAATGVAMIASFAAVSTQPPIYQARTTLIIGQAINNPNTTGNEFWLGQQLAQTYADVAGREPVRQATMEALGLDWLPEYTARTLPNSQLVEIAVTDTSPERAMVVARELAKQVILRSPTNSQQEDGERQAFVNEQLNSLETQIEATTEELEAKQAELATLFSARQIADTQVQVAALEEKLNTLQANYAALLANTTQGAINTLGVFEDATLPTTPIGPNVGMTVLTAGAIGFLLAAAAAFLLEYLDNSIKTPEDIDRIMELPVIGYITDSSSISGKEEGLIVAEQPRSPITESFRTLRTNLEFAGVDKTLKTILVTSPSPSEGKTTIAANLAAVMAQGNKRVILLDADLRRPRVHQQLALSNRRGLSDLFRGETELRSVIRSWNRGFAVITSGSLPPNPTEVLGSERMSQLLEQLKQFADVVVIDSPPSLVTDASVLAAKVDGVILVIRPGHTQVGAARVTQEHLSRVGARVVGVVLNRVPRKGDFYYGGYQYYNAPSYYLDEDEVPQLSDSHSNGRSNSKHKGRLAGIFGRSKPASASAGDRL